MRNQAFPPYLRTTFLSGIAALALWAPEAFAQAKRYYDLPAQETAPAIQRLAIESKIQIMIPVADLADVLSNPVKGEYTYMEIGRASCRERV